RSLLNPSLLSGPALDVILGPRTAKTATTEKMVKQKSWVLLIFMRFFSLGFPEKHGLKIGTDRAVIESRADPAPGLEVSSIQMFPPSDRHNNTSRPKL